MAEPTLHFDRFPTCRTSAQRDTQGKLWRIVRIEAPYCWAAPYRTGTSNGPFTKYRIEVVRRSPAFVSELRMAGAL